MDYDTRVANVQLAFRSAADGNMGSLETVVGMGVSVESVDAEGLSLLHIAASGGHTDVCKYLLKKRANPNAKDSLGTTPLHIACWKGHVGCADMLLQNGAIVNMTSLAGRTALHAAAYNGNSTCILLLVKHGIDIDIVDVKGKKAHEVASTEHIADLIRNGGEGVEERKVKPDSPFKRHLRKHRSQGSLLTKDDVVVMDADALHSWLIDNQLEAFADIFREEQFDISSFKDITEDDLDRIGITAIGHRRKILASAAKLRTAVEGQERSCAVQ